MSFTCNVYSNSHTKIAIIGQQANCMESFGTKKIKNKKIAHKGAITLNTSIQPYHNLCMHI